MKISRRLILAALTLSAGLAASSCARFEGAFSFLREPPVVEKIPGVYTLDPEAYSFAMLKKQGYADQSAALTLRADGSFTVKRLPDSCVYGEYEYYGGYFDGAGEWSVEKNQSVFDVRLKFKTLKRAGETRIKLPEHDDEVSFTLTKTPDDYGLAAPLFDGEFRYVYFKRAQR